MFVGLSNFRILKLSSPSTGKRALSHLNTISRMDPAMLKTAENMDLLILIAPSAIDSQKIREWMEAHPGSQFNEEEQLLTTVREINDDRVKREFQLAQIKNLEERLCIMRHMARFDMDLTAISDQLASLSSVAKALLSSAALKSLVQLVLASQNAIYSASTPPIRGFIVSQLEDICQYKLSSGQPLLSVVASLVKEHSELSAIFELIPMLEAASKSEFLWKEDKTVQI